MSATGTKERIGALALCLVTLLAVGSAGCPAQSGSTGSECGDGVLDEGEQCDNGEAYNSDLMPDACRTTCRLPRCGDLVIDSGEECDDGNMLALDGCDPTCQLEPACGDGEVGGFEECDDGNNLPGDGCDETCHNEFACGDGLCETGRGETCPLCPADCCPCGDGECQVALGESCSLCHEDCCPDCGNGVLDSAEQCDDGNLLNGDGCSKACDDEDGVATCGNGIWEVGEACEDGNQNDLDGCSSTCELEYTCGDGVCETNRGEGCPVCPEDCCPCGDGTCEAGIGETCAMCHADCCPNCGDGLLDSYEECDDGNAASGDGCSTDCEDEDGVATCGNGIWETGENCDDGNTANGDGCSDVCLIEFVCGDAFCDSANGETCQLCTQDCCPSCGNGVRETGQNEECDGSDLSGLTCADFCYPGGALACTSYCTFNLNSCTGALPTCGDGVADCGEDCDGADLGGLDCNGLGHDGGTLACDGGCSYDVSGCGALLQYFLEDFENPSTISNWTLGGIWDHGAPTYSSGPTSAYSGANVIGTNVAGAYTNSCAYAANRAETPPIDLTVANQPVLRFYMWVYTETGFDGGSLFIDTGTGFQHLASPTPAYNNNHGGYDCWAGSTYAAWTEVTVDLTAYVGNTVRIGFAFYSDGSVTYPGFYIDDVVVAEPGALP